MIVQETDTETARDELLPELAPEATLREVLHWAVAHGCLAPSELNSQPWLFHADVAVGGDSGTLDLLLDQSRILTAVDPSGREAVLACGAALLNVRLALRGARLGTHVRLCPDPSRPELLARLTVQGQAAEPLEDHPLRLAIPLRSTHRGPFLPGGVPDDLAERLIAEAAYEGAFVAELDAEVTSQLAVLNHEAEGLLWTDTSFRREVATWTRRNTTRDEDGVPGSAYGLKAWQSWLEPARLRTGRASAQEQQEERAALEGAPLTFVLASTDDSRTALLRAGCGLQRLLLAARTMGLSAGYLNAALHLEPLRAAVARLIDLDHPQVILRLGYANVDRPTPRRTQADVLRLSDRASL